MEREGCCNKLCLGCVVCSDACANEAFVHAGAVAMTKETPPGKLPKDHVIGRAKVPVPFAGGLTPTVQVMDRTPTSDVHWANVTGPTCFGGCSELCCTVPFAVKRVDALTGKTVFAGPDGTGQVATIKKIRPKSMSEAARELLTDSDMFELEILDTSITPQQRATLIGTALLMDYMFFERDLDMISCDANGNITLNLFNCFCCGTLNTCKISKGGKGGGN